MNKIDSGRIASIIGTADFNKDIMDTIEDINIENKEVIIDIIVKAFPIILGRVFDSLEIYEKDNSVGEISSNLTREEFSSKIR